MARRQIFILLSTLSLGFPVFAQDITDVIQPNGVTLAPFQQQQFTAGGYGQNVTWWIRPAGMGTITSTGLYSAPGACGVVYIHAQPPGGGPFYINTVYLSGGPNASGPCPVAPSAPTSGVSVNPSFVYLLVGQSTAFQAMIGGVPSNQQVQWSVSPNLGSIVNGIYTAPASLGDFGHEAEVTISATSLADSRAIGAATVLLGQAVSAAVSISIAQGPTTLTAGQSAQYTATVVGSANTGVNWLVTPSRGSVFNGLYTAPPNISLQEMVTVTAISQADPTKTASVTVMLQPPNVAVSLSPGSASLTGGQSATFKPLVSGTSNTALTWTLNPQVGTIDNGVYQAPSIIGAQQTVTVTATSVADPTKSASVTVWLQPIGVTVGPASASVGDGGSAAFAASVTGTGNTGVSWSLNPAVGTIVNGIYAAPAVIGTPQTVTLTATSVVDSTKSATASINLTSASLSVSPGSASLTGGQSATFTPVVSGTSNTAVMWSLSPQVGTITNGVYQAPAIIANQQAVTVTATSVVDSTKSASATVSLQPVGVTVGPASVSLGDGGSANFAATVTGTSNTAVNWSLSPAVGTVSNGVYTAPASISSSQTVTLTAASVADSSKTATASINLTAVNLTVSPGSASLMGGQSATFTTVVSGTPNTATTWSLSPQVGTVTNGVYQAPAIVASQQTVTVTATSAADSTKSASATVSLQPIGVTVGPGSASVGAGQSATFSASVTGTSNTAVTWSLSATVGTLVNGVYTAPAAINSAQTVMVVAASVADSTKTATASVNLTPSSNGSGTVTLPVEVIGPNGTTISNTVNIPSGANLNGQPTLWMQIHGLRSETQASVQVNNSGWLPINSSTVTLLGNAAAYGGIGGGFSTLKMTMNLPAGTVQTGANTIAFRFNQTDGRVSGFRVLAFNVQAADGTNLITGSTFVNDDPNTWQPPSTNPSDVAAGQTLWRQGALTVPVTSGGTKPILAHCSDCHAQDGRDLKYFNYSNNSIQGRSMFHGLTAQQGDQIASYIRSLNVVNPGRPWNPPYQPGPGLDSQPVSSWSAGAGIDAVLDSDQQMINAIFPSGIQPSVFADTSRLNQRELPLPVQLPDWNQWLPGTHPIDAFGSAFTSNGYYTIYQTLSSSLQVNDPATYVAQKGNFDNWFGAYYGLYNQIGAPIWNNPTAMWTPATVDAMYSLAQWGLVKTWELNNQFQLEGLSQSVFGPQADARAWYSDLVFFVSPHEIKMPNAGPPGLRNGSAADYTYLSYVWYNLQLILNDSNGQQSYQYPIDWSYIYGFVKDLGSLSAPQGGIQTMWMIKGLETMQQLGKGPQLSGSGWQPFVVQPSWLVTPEWNLFVWSGVDPSTRTAIASGIVRSWLSQASQFTPQQFYAGNWTTPTAVPVRGGNAYDNVFPDWVWYMIPRFKTLAVDPALASQLAAWAQTVWPNANWTADLNATCSWGPDPNYPVINCNQ